MQLTSAGSGSFWTIITALATNANTVRRLSCYQSKIKSKTLVSNSITMLMFCNPKTKSICSNSRLARKVLSCLNVYVSSLTLAWLWRLLLEHIAIVTITCPNLVYGICVLMTRLASDIMAKRLLTKLALDRRYAPPKKVSNHPKLIPSNWLALPPASKANRWLDLLHRKEAQ